MTTAEHTLARLRAEFPQWHIWRSHGDRAAWYASKRRGAPEEWAPTLAADTLAELKAQMADPPERWAKPFSSVGAAQ